MRFEFVTAARIIFGPGTLAEVGPLAREIGRHALVVTGRNQERAARLRQFLRTAGVESTVCSIANEPALDDITRGTALARGAGCDFLIGFGGGAALDAAKAIAALLTNARPLLDYLEVVGGDQPLVHPAAPCIAIPTTAGTGAEVTRNAVLASPAHRVKVSLRSPHMLPRVALVDPELTRDLPPEVTAASGLDALTQLIEPYVSCRATPLTDPLCIDGIRRVARSLRHAVEDGANLVAREDMSLASLFGGLALANAGLGAVHGFAGPIGGMFPAPHGAVCAALLPDVMDANLAALRSRQSQLPALRRYNEIGRLVTGNDQATADDGVAWIRDLIATVKIPPLRNHGIRRADFAAIVEGAAKASSMKANPLPLSEAELHAILERAF